MRGIISVMVNPSHKAAPTAERDTGIRDSYPEIYRKSLELAETNKTLTLLRKIDQAVLRSVNDMPLVMCELATAIAEDSGFPFAAVYLRDNSKHQLQPQAVVIRIGDPKVQEEIQAYLMGQPLGLRHATHPVVRAVRELWIVPVTQLFEVVQPHLPIEEAEEAQERLSLTSFFICPLQARNQVIGAMVLGSPQGVEELGFYQKSLLEQLTIAVGIATDNALLYAETQEAATHLRAVNRHLRDLDKIKDEFISVASHQLRTPLASIKGYVSMLLEGDGGPLTPIQREFLAYAFGSSQRMVSLISDLLNLSRIAAGKFAVERVPVNLEKLVNEEVQQQQPQAHVRKLKLAYTPPTEPLPMINLDESKTREVVMNFIDNAIYYTKSGSVQVKLSRQGDRAELRVEDTGIGVPRAARTQLFSKFFRAPNAQAMRPDGTGLGLFLAKRVVEDQGGTIIFESVEDKGSCFGFSMPLTEDSDGTDK